MRYSLVPRLSSIGRQAAEAADHRREAERHHAAAHDRDPDASGEYEPREQRTMGDTGPATHDANAEGETYRERRFVHEDDDGRADTVRADEFRSQRRQR